MRTELNIYTNPAGFNHDTGPGHPEQIARLETVLSLFKEKPFSDLPLIECHEDDTAPLLYAHPQSYIDAIMDSGPDSGYAQIDADVIMSPGTWQAAVTAANTLCRAVDDVMAGKCARAFCAVRPPGHHAEPGRAMGFCFFGNIFIGARHAQEKYGARRIAIVDFDVHHGNGTEDMVRRAEGIFFISSHQMPLYPGTGDPQDNILPPGLSPSPSLRGGESDEAIQNPETGQNSESYILNIPLPPGTGSAAFRKIYEEKVFPALENFRPELLMISAGFDAHGDDPLAGLNLTEDDYFWVTEKLCALADKYSGGKVISTLEGGYNLKALKASVAAHLKAMAV